MGLFQRSVLSKFLKQQDTVAVSKAYKKFSKHFHNAHIQENIRNSKEEQYQEGFLRELFVDVFGYTLNPQPKYNLTTELKNEKGSKKVDGAILKDGNALGVVELKGTDTKDLEKVRQQAFDYKANQTGCVYVITSNFEKLRFYINNAVEWEEFDLFTITEQRFELLYLCLAADNLLNNVPLRIKEASIAEEENITKKFYADYSLFKRELFRSLVKENMRNEVFRNVLAGEESISKADKNIKLNLFKKSQKLIDRFLFIFFSEDRGLLPPNSTLQILEEYDKLKSMDAHVPLYNRFKLYFNYLDQGRKGTAEKAEIFAYNGGLFKPDPTLDSLIIDDDLLYKHAKSLAKYDFESQVDVNILGHIFENSLNEIESVNAEIEGVEFDKQKTKRKKDGVFYTPKYITKYIVDNTVGKLCIEKKAELGIIDEEYTSNRQKDTKKKLLDKLEQYRAWLLEITICDPACGSGAFLNQALDFLINEHKSIDELQASLLGGGLVFPDIENTILENNIYGVDLNEESIEIAKLSLWLRTAQPRRKLNDLNNNIKCGNSLIDSKAVAGDKAFNWSTEFPEVFEKGGFDVVIGNPPYAGRSSSINEEAKTYVKKVYKTSEGKFELYQLFIEKCLGITNHENGFISLITPQTWLSIIQATKLRKLVLEKKELKEIVFLGKDVFEDASVDSIIFTIKLGSTFNELAFLQSNNLLNESYEYTKIPISSIDAKTFTIPITSNLDTSKIFTKISYMNPTMEEIGEWSDGVKIVGQAKEFAFQQSKVNSTFHPMLVGKDIERYSIDWGGLYCCRDKEAIQAHNATDIRLRDESMFQREKILIRKTGNEIVATLDLNNHYNEQSLFSYGLTNDAYNIRSILGILNSKLANFILKENAFSKKETFPQIRLHWLKDFPISMKTMNCLLPNLVEQILTQQEEFGKKVQSFEKFLQSKFSGLVLTKKINVWYSFDFGNFITELNKAIKTTGGEPLTKLQEMEWMEVFETKKKEVMVLKAEIQKTDKEIDWMVYELYGLTEEEIKIVEMV